MRLAATLLLSTLMLPSGILAAQDAPLPNPEAAIIDPLSSDLTLYALSLNGTAYKYGGRDPESGLDCSGFVGHVFRQMAGVDLPRSASAISQIGQKIGVEELRPGDLVFFNTLRRAFSHVGIYLGNNQFIHASSSRTGDVMISDMTERYWSRRFNGARRLDVASQ